MTVLGALAAAAEALRAANVRFALVGGLAVSVRAEPRFTRDADIAVAVTDDVAAEATVRGLVLAGFRIVASVEHEATVRLATVRLAAPSVTEDGPVVDLLFASSGIEPEIVAGASLEEIAPGLVLPVASIGHLIAMKVLSEQPARFQDSADLVALLAMADPADLAVARRAIELIDERGAARGKDLQATLDRYIGLAAKPKDASFPQP